MIDFLLLNRDGTTNNTDTPTFTVSVDGAAFGTGGGTITDRGGSGIWRYEPDATELAAQSLAIRITEPESISQVINYRDVIKNDANNFISVQLINATDGSDGTVTPLMLVSIDSGEYVIATGTLINAGNGVWTYQPTAAECNSDSLRIMFGAQSESTPVLVNVFPQSPAPAPDYPDVTDVRQGVEYDSGNLTGTLDLPDAVDVVNTVTFDNGVAGRWTITNLTLQRVIENITFGPDGSLVGRARQPDVTDVRQGVEFGDVSGPQYVGTLDLPATNDVRLGVEFDGASKTGLVTIPQTKDVRLGIQYDEIGGLKEQGGRLQLPTETNVRDGVGYGDLGAEFTGNVVLPVVGDVRDGTSYGANGTELTGTLDPGSAADYPAVTDVRLGIEYDGGNLTGTLDLPADDKVIQGTSYDNGTKSGRWWTTQLLNRNVLEAVTAYGVDGAQVGTATLPAVGDVRDGVIYGDGLSQGTLELPTDETVLAPVKYGAGGTEFTGRYQFVNLQSGDNVLAGTTYGVDGLSTGNYAPALETDVRDAVAYGSPNAQKTGNVTLPLETQVLNGVDYGANGNEFTGSLDVGGGTVPRYPAETDVRDGVAFGDEGVLQYVGNLLLPLESDVRSGVLFGANGTEFTGSLIVAESGFVPPSSNFEIVQRNSYEGDDAVKWSDPGTWPSDDQLAESTLQLTVKNRGAEIIIGTPTIETVDGARVMAVDLSSDDTNVASGRFRYDVVAVDSEPDPDFIKTLARGFLTVSRIYTNPDGVDE